MHALGVEPTSTIAKALYVGLITDTGRFMYENTGPGAHLMAAELIEAGVDVTRSTAASTRTSRTASWRCSRAGWRTSSATTTAA